MTSVYSLVHDYQTLRAMQQLVRGLDPADEARLLGLVRLLDGDGCPGEGGAERGRRTLPRLSVRTPAHVGRDGSLVHVDLRNLSGDGATIRGRLRVEIGDEVFLHVSDAAQGFDYVFPARVVWASGGDVGLRFERVPTRVLAPGHRPAIPYVAH